MAGHRCYYCQHPITAPTQQCPSCNRVLVLHNRYWLVRVLGKGGFGIVYEAIDARLKRRCAVKQISASSLAEQRQIEAEAGILSQYASQLPFIPDIYDIWSEQSQTFMVMEYIDGHTLEQLLVRPWPGVHVESFMRTILGHLVELHNAGVVHRDIKPANVKRTPDGRYVLLDFGIAKQGGATQTAAKAASLEYAPPEQLLGSTTDARSDLYSLGATAYHLLTGQPPTRMDIRLSTRAAVQPASQLVAGVPPALDALLQRMLELDPQQRPPSAQAALQLLDAAVLPGAAGQPGLPTQVLPATELVPSLPAVSSDPMPAQRQAAPPRPLPPSSGDGEPSSRLALEALAMVLLVVLSVVGYGWYQARSVSTQSAEATSRSAASRERQAQLSLTQEARDTSQTATAEMQVAPTRQAEATAAAQVQATATAQMQALTSSPQHAAAAAREREVVQSWQVLLFDQFDTNSNFWPLERAGGGASVSTQGILSGKYRWDIKSSSGVIFTAGPNAEETADVYLDVDVRRLKGPQDSTYGIVFRQATPDDYYVFLVNDNQLFGCFLNTGGRSIPLINWTHSAAIRPGAENRLTVLAEGAHFRLFINGVLAGEATDSKLPSGYAGLATVLLGGKGEAGYEFDNFELRAP